MQILFGEWKGRRLKTPPNGSIRPTTGRMRDWLCNVLQDRMRHAQVLDLFAGCGTLGLHALSMGASHALFVELAPQACKLIRANLDMVGAGSRASLLPLDVFRFLKRPSGGPWDLIFVDPPYEKMDYGKLLLAIHGADILKAGGLLVVEHPTPLTLPETGLVCSRSKRFGRSTISFLEHRADQLDRSGNPD